MILSCSLLFAFHLLYANDALLYNDWEFEKETVNGRNSMEGHLVTTVIAFGLHSDFSSRILQLVPQNSLIALYCLNVVYNKSRDMVSYFELNRKSFWFTWAVVKNLSWLKEEEDSSRCCAQFYLPLLRDLEPNTTIGSSVPVYIWALVAASQMNGRLLWRFLTALFFGAFIPNQLHVSKPEEGDCVVIHNTLGMR